MSSHGTPMQEVTKEELNMISSVADIETDELNESTFLRRSGRLTKSQAAPVPETLPLKEDVPGTASTLKPSRRIAPMKTKVISPSDPKTLATVKLSKAATAPITTSLTVHEASMADTQKSTGETATKDTKITKPTGRKSSVKRQNPSIGVESTPAVAQQQDSAAYAEAITPPNTDDVDEEMSSAIEDIHDTDFVPDVTPSDNLTSVMHSLPPLGGALPASPPSSVDALSPSNKRKSDGSTSEDSSPAKRPNSKKTPSKAKPSQGAKLTNTNKGPLSHGTPLVWAEGRQALCETLDYYRAYQSGGYTLNGAGYGFLLDKDVGERSYMDEEVVIARCGGGVAMNEDGRMTQAVDQKAESARVTSWEYNMQNKVPVVLIVGSHNDHCPSVIPYRYCVMDHFQVTDLWAEQTNGKTIFKVRFEKIHLDEKSWWAVRGSPPPPHERDFNTIAIRRVCGRCDITSKRVFQQGWTCLNEKCKDFWLINGVLAPKQLTYSDGFLQERRQWPKSLTMPYPLKPEPLAQDTGDDAGFGVSRVCWKGMACPKCGRCNSRTHWDAWRCETGGCGFTYTVKQCVLSPRAVLGDHEIEYTGHAMLKDTCLSYVTPREYELIGDWRVNTFDLLPGNLVTHFCSNSIINKKPSGPDQLFRDLQGTDIGLQRYALATSGLAGPALTKHFTANFGMPYKYVADQETTSLAEAPRFILNALHRLTWAGEHTVNNGSFQKFNEVLTLGYFEKQAIGYHDDGEKELGPTIATLSLGCKAIMTLRMKATHYWGISKSRIYNPRTPVLPGCYKEHERRALNAKFGTISDAAFEAERVAIFEGCNRRQSTPVLLTVHLHHGDMVIMHGADMQKYYEHSVVPENQLRFALTARYIRPELIDLENHWKGDYTPDPELIYNGDLPPAPANTTVAVHRNNGSSTGVAGASTAHGGVTMGS